MLKNIYQIVEDSADQYPNHLALVFGQYHIQYNKIKEATNRLAQGFKKIGLAEKDRMAIMLPNVPHFPISYYALLQIGITVVPIPIHFHLEEMKRCLIESRVRGIVFWEKFRSQIHQATQEISECEKLIVLGDKAESGEHRLTYLIEACDPFDGVYESETNETGIIAYTSGTTGPSQGVEITHQNILSNVNACCDFFKFNPEDSVLGVLPFSHLFGQTLVMNSFLHAGAKIILSTRFGAASIFKMIEKEQPNYLIGIPSLFEDMLIADKADQFNLKSLKFCLSVGSALRQDTMEAFEKKFSVSILEGYGLTEASPIVSFNLANSERRAGSIGLPLRGIEMKIVDDKNVEVRPGEIGEIIVQGSNVMKGYLNRPEKTDQVIKDGWLRTGDLALLKDNGFGFFTVQKKNMIVKSGFHIYPNEIETLLCQHLKIENAVIIGIMDSNKEEQIHAYILLKQEEQATPEEIIQYCNEHMPAYKCPQIIHFVSAFPTGQTGSIMREKIGQFVIQN